MKYFDLHCHPALKTFLGSTEEIKRKNAWQKIGIKGILKLIDGALGQILNSQASLSQITKGNFIVNIDLLRGAN